MIKFLRAYDRDTGSALFLNDKLISTVNYDEHGSTGEYLLFNIAKELAETLNLEFVKDEVDDDEYAKILGWT